MLPLILHHGTRVTLFGHFTGGEWYLTVTVFNVPSLWFTANPASLSLHSLACLLLGKDSNSIGRYFFVSY